MKKITKRKRPYDRKLEMLERGIEACKTANYRSINMAEIARQGGFARALFTYYFKSVKNYRSKLLTHAIVNEYLHVIAQGLAVKDPLVKHISPALKKRAIAFLAK